MDLENKNDVLDTETVNEDEETEKAIDSFLNGSVYTEEDAKKDKAASKFVTSKEAALCGISLLALVTWGFSIYGAIVVSALSVLGMIFMNAGKNAKRFCISNALTVGTLATTKFTLSAIQAIVALFYTFVLEKNIPVRFTNFISIINEVVLSVVMFILFLISALCILSKTHTPIFGGTAKKYAEQED